MFRQIRLGLVVVLFAALGTLGWVGTGMVAAQSADQQGEGAVRRA